MTRSNLPHHSAPLAPAAPGFPVSWAFFSWLLSLASVRRTTPGRPTQPGCPHLRHPGQRLARA